MHVARIRDIADNIRYDIFSRLDGEDEVSGCDAGKIAGVAETATAGLLFKLAGHQIQADDEFERLVEKLRGLGIL